MRDPSIHIRKSDLKKIFVSLGLDTGKVNDLLSNANMYPIRDRVFVTTKAAGKKKSDRSVAVEANIVEKFNKIYSVMNLENNIKAMPIYKNSSQYLVLKEVAKQALDFCHLFTLSQDEGFKVYIQFAMQILGRKYSIYRMKGVADRIVGAYLSLVYIDSDVDKDGTKRMYETWRQVMLKRLGREMQSELTPDKYVSFIYARENADKLKATYLDWIEAQFDKWEFLNSVPEFSQLYGENAVLIYEQYIASQGVTSSSERAYFDKVRGKGRIPLRKPKRGGGHGK